jgi:hypothetical protein
MKITRWAMLKIVLILFLTIGVAAYPSDSIEDAWVLGIGAAILLGSMALFQAVLWLGYDENIRNEVRGAGWRAIVGAIAS